MQLEEGNVIGFNLLLNDANLLGNRDHTFEITEGINTRKYPAAYRDWLFVGAETRTDNGWDSVAQIFTPTFEATEIGGFTDISGHWAEQSIKDAYNKGLVSGMSKTSYAPDESLSVAQALQLIKNVYALPDAEYGGEFSDVGAEDWYAGAVASVAAAGMLPEELAPGGTLSPHREITREEFAMVIAAADKEYQSAGLTFADAADVSENAKNAVGYVFEKGYMIGDDENRFEPKKPLTRAEAAVVMLKIAN